MNETNFGLKEKSIGTYLDLGGKARFVIPEYQRAYSWGIEDCDKLWTDIKEYADSESKEPYFFGTIIINNEEDGAKNNLIDGQQRTTTFILLLKAFLLRINYLIKEVRSDKDSEHLLDNLKERRKQIMSYLYNIDSDDVPGIPDENDEEIQKNITIMNSSINEMFSADMEHILKSQDFEEAERGVEIIPYKQKENRFSNYFKNFKYFYEQVRKMDSMQVNSMARTILKQCQIIEIKTWDPEQAIAMFNSLNSTGVPLSDSDIISAQLYSSAGDGNNNIGDEWKQIVNGASALNDKGITELDGILTQLMYYKRAVSGYSDTPPQMRKFFMDQDNDLKSNPEGFCQDLMSVVNIWDEIKDYTSIKILLYLNRNFKYFVMSYLMRYKDKFKDKEITEEKTITEESIQDVVEAILKLFILLEVGDAPYSHNNYKGFLLKEQILLVDEKKEEKDIVADFRRHIMDNWDKEDIVERIRDYAKKGLVFVNEYVFAKEKGENLVLGNDCDVEHIMPDSGRNLDVIREDADIDSREEFLDYVNMLGNKIVLESKINRSLGNDWFRTKVSRKVVEKKGYVGSRYPMANSIVEKYKDDPNPKWTKNEISLATDEIAERIARFIFE